MRTRRTTLLMMLLFLCGTVSADRALDRAEILQIISALTNQPLETWIHSGTISATHEQYRAPRTTNTAETDTLINQAIQEHENNPKNADIAPHIKKMKLDAIPFNFRHKYSNEYTMTTNETVTYDGNRFRWKIKVNSRTDSVKPGPELKGNSMTNHFDLAYNGERTFIWDGQQYTLQSNSHDSSFVDAGNKLRRAVNGPLTAGIIPWGHGAFSYADLAALQSSAVEKDSNGRRIHLKLDKPDGSRMVFVLDADNDYAVISFTTEGLRETTSRNYGAYRLVGGRLVPYVIEIEKHNAFTNALVARDSWIITSIDPSAPSSSDFRAAYADGARIEYSPPFGPSVLYSYSSRLDTDLLLAERLGFAGSQDGQPRNCATAALRYAALRLGRHISGTQLCQIVDRKTGGTSLLAMKELLYRQGLHCRAVRTDIATLQSLTDCQAILHIPHKSHFVLLGDIDSQSIWTIDLAGRKFCSRTDVSFFGMDWTQGTALLISGAPIAGAFDDISTGELGGITGRGGYTCTYLIQEDKVIFCEYDEAMAYCPPTEYEYYPERWACEPAETGWCVNDNKLRLAMCTCMLNTSETDCTVDGDWDFWFVRACQ